jgi:hypothetical protein
VTKGSLKLAELKIYLPDGLNERFRRIAMSVHGYGRGSLSKAAEEALMKWCSEREHSIPEKSVGLSETTQDPSSKEAESHNPDERSHIDVETKGFRENRSLNPTGSSS